MIKLYFFYTFEDGMQVLEFNSDADLEKFLDINKNCVEVFDVR